MILLVYITYFLPFWSWISSLSFYFLLPVEFLLWHKRATHVYVRYSILSIQFVNFNTLRRNYVLIFSLLHFILIKIKCTACSESCALVPPADKAGFPCYQGSVKDANVCFDTVIRAASSLSLLHLTNYLGQIVISCYCVRLQYHCDDTLRWSSPPWFACRWSDWLTDWLVGWLVVYVVLLVLAQDPLLAEGTTWQCGTCNAAGYDTYLQWVRVGLSIRGFEIHIILRVYCIPTFGWLIMLQCFNDTLLVQEWPHLQEHGAVDKGHKGRDGDHW